MIRESKLCTQEATPLTVWSLFCHRFNMILKMVKWNKGGGALRAWIETQTLYNVPISPVVIKTKDKT